MDEKADGPLPQTPTTSPNVLSYGVKGPRPPPNTFVRFLLIVLGAVVCFVASIVGVIAFFDAKSLVARAAGGTLLAGVLSWVTYLIVQSWLQKRRVAEAQRRSEPPAPPLTRKQKVRLVLGTIAFWTAIIAWKLLPHLIEHWMDGRAGK
jgi:hypothetical protein